MVFPATLLDMNFIEWLRISLLFSLQAEVLMFKQCIRNPPPWMPCLPTSLHHLGMKSRGLSSPPRLVACGVLVFKLSPGDTWVQAINLATGLCG